MQRILRENSIQHNIFKENIDIINRKCHDVKFMLSSLSDKGHDIYIEELKRAVDIYEAAPKTGNMVLDVVLSENILRAKEAGVEISCVADGKLLDFIAAAPRRSADSTKSLRKCRGAFIPRRRRTASRNIPLRRSL